MWTPDALQSNAHPYAGRIWRLVELQARAATMGLVDSVEEQSLLEDILEETKPLLPPECAGLDFLLATPFRYEPYDQGSRFRRAHQPDGVYYGTQEERTAVAETAFYTLLFFHESPSMTLPTQAVERTGFQVSCKTEQSLNLTNKPFIRNKKKWLAMNDYAHCQELADTAREASIDAILYQSVRDPDHGLNVALLSPRAFSSKKPLQSSLRTWRFHVTRESVRAIREFPVQTVEFSISIWAEDPRMTS